MSDGLPGRRPRCPRCLRAAVVCTCAHLQPIETRTRVLILQHPRERRVPIGTARLAHLGLPNSLLRVGIDFSQDEIVRALLADGAPHLLFPGERALPIESLAGREDVTLVVLDGTWWQARKLLRSNPALGALPRVALTPAAASGYRIRRQPALHCVSTIEAIAQALDALEPDAGGFEALLAPFRAMVDGQVRFATEVRSGRHAHGMRRPRARRESLGQRLSAVSPRLVLVQGEANAWPSRAPNRPPPEIIHWVAVRPATGARFEAVIRPRHPFSPSTPSHAELAAEAILGGETLEAAQARWQAFSQPDDVVAAWGLFYAELARGEGVALPEVLDLRTALSQERRARTGMIDEALASVRGDAAAPEAPPIGAGRAGRRLGALGALVEALVRG